MVSRSIVSIFGKLAKPSEKGALFGFDSKHVFVIQNEAGFFKVETDSDINLARVGDSLHIDGELRTRKKGGMYIFANRIAREL